MILRLLTAKRDAKMYLVAYYEAITLLLAKEMRVSDGLLHVHAGMALLLLARVTIRRSLGSWVPFLVVCAFELGNEVLDRLNHGKWDWPDTLSDVIVTLFWPFVLTSGAWLKRVRETRRARAVPVGQALIEQPAASGGHPG